MSLGDDASAMLMDGKIRPVDAPALENLLLAGDVDGLATATLAIVQADIPLGRRLQPLDQQCTHRHPQQWTQTHTRNRTLKRRQMTTATTCKQARFHGQFPSHMAGCGTIA